MIKLECFSIRDSKAELFVSPIFSPTIATALRMFETAVNKPDQDFNNHPGDFSIFHLGTFDQTSGMFEPLPAPVNLGLALNFLKENA